MFRYSFVKVLFQEKMFPNKSTSGWSISRILSNGKPRKRDCSTCAVISLGGASPRRSMQPTRGWLIPQEGRAHAETSSLPSSTDDFAPAWPCSRRGLPGHLHYGKCRWSLTPPFHHHPSPRRMEGLFVSVALFRQVHALRQFPRPGNYPTSRSMECGLSSIPTTQDRDCPTSLS